MDWFPTCSAGISSLQLKPLMFYDPGILIQDSVGSSELLYSVLSQSHFCGCAPPQQPQQYRRWNQLLLLLLVEQVEIASYMMFHKSGLSTDSWGTPADTVCRIGGIHNIQGKYWTVFFLTQLAFLVFLWLQLDCIDWMQTAYQTELFNHQLSLGTCCQLFFEGSPGRLFPFGSETKLCCFHFLGKASSWCIFIWYLLAC